MSSPSVSPKPLPPTPSTPPYTTQVSPEARKEKATNPLITSDEKTHTVKKGPIGDDTSSDTSTIGEDRFDRLPEVPNDRSLTATPTTDDLTYLFPFSSDDSLSESSDVDTYGELPRPPYVTQAYRKDSDTTSLPDYAGSSNSIESSSRSNSNAALNADEQIQSILDENTPLDAAQMVFEKLKPAAIKALEKGELKIVYKTSKDKDNSPIYIIKLKAVEGAGIASKIAAKTSKPAVVNSTELNELYTKFVSTKTSQEDEQKQNFTPDDSPMRYTKLKPSEDKFKPKY